MALRIKRLQLVGFKSCMDRTMLEFPRGITGIVGPNGCGKSNIVDALRWVLGEQSARHLRGATMEDVIFAGNDRYGALGAAEVTIVFDNEEGLPHLAGDETEDEPSVAAALRDVPEIEVTRRLFRSGESEYLINGRVCRLRDITELFLGTGVGTKAYSIIEQGRVGQIVGAKPEELRLYIEEAAGTTLYRSRKLAAERKIERTRNNLLRVNDLVHELERQAASLRRQARGAERYAELKAQEADLDRRLGAFRLRVLAKRVSELEQSLQAVVQREAQAAEELQAAVAQRESLRVRHRESDERTEEARRALYEARGRATQVEQERRHLEQRVAELGRACDHVRRELGEIEQRAVTLTADEADLGAAQADIARDVQSVDLERAEKERILNELESESRDLSSRAESVKAALVDAMAREAALNNEHAGLNRQLEATVHKERRLGEEREALSTLVTELGSALAECRRRLDGIFESLRVSEGGKETASARLATLLARRGEAERRVDASRAELGTLSSRYASLCELNESFEGYGDGVRRFMSNGGRDCVEAAGVVADLIEIDSGFERAVAAVLQERLQYVVVPDPDAGIRGATYLRETGAGRASFIPRAPRAVPAPNNAPPPGFSLLGGHVRAREGYEGIVSTLLEGVVVADDLETATEQWKLNGTYVTFVTRDGDVLDCAGVITGGSGRPLEEGLLARKAELRGLEESLALAKRELTEAEAALETLRAEAAGAGDELARLDREVHELTVGRVAAEGDLELHRQNLARTEERASAVQTELSAIHQEKEAARNRIAVLAAELTRIRAALTEGNTERERLDAERRDADERRRVCAGELEQVRVRAAELRQKREHGELRLRTLRASLDELGGRRETLRTRLAQDEGETEIARERLASPDFDLDAAAAVVTAAEVAFEGVRAEYARLQQESEAVQARLDGISAARDEIRDARSRLELSLKECGLEGEAITHGLRERLGVDVADVLWAVAEQEEDTAALEEELDRIQASIRRLGAVNVGAVSELQELENRLQEMTSQQQDLEKSIEDLRGTIARLNRLSRQRFKETFDAVNAIFQETFPKLFLGGRAWLALTDEANLLETGVEIYVRPPGKKVGNLDLLSGGEKALTAVSLIFSLFLHKPSPFCVLDEVDAPLDDANIGRFARMVNDMSDRSQFVLITHNKRTMECCNMLYGVTMREPGVSKIVSVEMAH